jgi:hypothetical protein
MKKNYIRKGGTFLLALIMLIAAASPGEVGASLSLTMYAGETYTASTAYRVKSVSSSKKSVASAARIKSYSNRVGIVAKNKGKTKVTIKTGGGTDTYNITVKKANITGTLTDLGNGYLLLAVKNSTAQTFDSIKMRYTIKDANGTVAETKKIKISDVVSGETVYKKIKYEGTLEPDLMQSSVKLISESKTWFAKYKKAKSSVAVSVTDEKDAENGSINFTIGTKNKLKKQFVKGTVYIFIYTNDEYGNKTLTDVQSAEFNLSAAKKKNFTLKNTFTGIDINSITYTYSTVSYYYTY